MTADARVDSVDPTALPHWDGYCPICDAEVTFRAHGPWYRDQLVCLGCGSVPRQRAIMLVLSIVRPLWRTERVWELAPAGAASVRLRTECADYVGTHFRPGVVPGTVVDGFRCEDVERSSFDDGSMDVIISSDVFEHVVDVDRAHAEIARVLASGGVHIWTVPQQPDLSTSRPRVRRSEGQLEMLLNPQYHDDPFNPDGALVTYDWGTDLPERVASASNLQTSTFRITSGDLGLLGEHLEVFVTQHERGPLAVDPSARLSKMSAELAAAQDELKAAGSRLTDAVAALTAQGKELDKIVASRSWRVTAPLRSLGAWLRSFSPASRR